MALVAALPVVVPSGAYMLAWAVVLVQAWALAAPAGASASAGGVGRLKPQRRAEDWGLSGACCADDSWPL